MAVLKSTFSALADSFLNDTFKDFRVSIDIVELVETPDGQGGFTVAPSTLATVNAFAFPMTGQEKIDAGRLASVQMFKFMFKPVTGLTTKMKIIYNSEDYQIRSTDDIAEAGVWLKVAGELGVTQ